MFLYELVDRIRRGHGEEWRSAVFQAKHRKTDDTDNEVDEEFDQLLCQSSLGTPFAQEAEAEMPDEVYHRLRAHQQARRRRQPANAPAAPDTDDIVLGVVRTAAGDEQPDLRDTCARFLAVYLDAHLSPELPALRHWLQLCTDLRRVRVTVAQDLVEELLEQGVFDIVRPDTARSIVEVGFANVRDLPQIVLAACAASAFSTDIAVDVFAPSLLASGAALTVETLHPTPVQEQLLRTKFRFHRFPSVMAAVLDHVVDPVAPGPWGRRLLERGPLGTPRRALTAGTATPSRPAVPARASTAPRRPQPAIARPARGPRHRRHPARPSRTKPRATPPPAGVPTLRRRARAITERGSTWLWKLRITTARIVSVSALALVTMAALIAQLT